jgi:maltose O-acetyltransferase
MLLLVTSGLSRAASVLRTAAVFPGEVLPFCHWSVTVKFAENIRIGKDVVVGPGSTLGAKGGIVLADYVCISEGVVIETAGLDYRSEPPYQHIARPIVLERGVWVGARAIILGGVTIGEGSVIGAGTVITQSVPPRTVVVGSAPRSFSKRSAT